MDTNYEGFASMYVRGKHPKTTTSESTIKEEFVELVEENSKEIAGEEVKTEVVDDVPGEHLVYKDEKEIDNEVTHTNGIDENKFYYTTSEVAEMLGISDQNVRNYTSFFADILDIETTASGHRRFTQENIDRLSSILMMKNNNGYTMAQTLAALSTDEGKIMVAKDDQERLKNLMEWTLKNVDKIVQNRVSEALNSQTAKIIESSEKSNQMLLEDNMSKDAQIADLKEQVINSSKLLEEVNKTLSDVMQSEKEKNDEIKALTELTSNLLKQNEQIIADMPKKKRGFFFK